MKLFLLALLAIIAVNAITTEESFKQWTLKHNKNYINDAEYTYRLGVYRSNLDFVEEHNRANKGFTVAINEFADMTATEFGDLYNNFMMPQDYTPAGPVYTHEGPIDQQASKDWRQHSPSCVSPIKNQEQCGSCWAFSTTGSTEGAYALKHNQAVVSLSEQNLVDCSGSYGNDGCDGGLMDSAFEYIVANGGIDTEASYPYTARDGTCSYSASNIGAQLTGHVDVQSQSETALQSAVNTVGPVSVAIDASHSSFQLYSSGIYYEPACSSTQLDHGVLAVGFGSNGGSDGNYWIVKNSWGTSWGMQGYIMMAKNRNNNCGIATMASYPLAK